MGKKHGFLVALSLWALSPLSAVEINTNNLVLLDPLPQERSELVDESLSSLWQEDWQAAFLQMKNENKPMLIAIIGDKNCPWSEKLLADVLYQSDFLQPLQSGIVLYKTYSSQLKENTDFFNEITLKQLPTLLLVAPDGKEIARFGYLPYAPKVFASHLLSIFKGYEELQRGLAQSEPKEIGDKELERFYRKAAEIGCSRIKERLFGIGMQRKKNLFFMLERYSQLLCEGKKKSDEAKSLKKNIQNLDPRNSKGSLRKIALMEFEAASRLKKNDNNPFAVIKPLVEYTKNFGSSDKEHLWEIEMKIAQFLFSKNKLIPAIAHAEASLKVAPEAAKEEIRESIEYLKHYQSAS